MARRRYSDEERAAALAALKANGGNFSLTAKQTGVPMQTIRHWAAGRCHPAVTKDGEQKARDMAEALEKVAWGLIDAMPGKVPEATLSQTATAFGIALDKMRLLRDQPTQITKTDATVTGRIEALSASLFASFESAADREEAGALPGDGAGKPLDTGGDPVRDDPEAG